MAAALGLEAPALAAGRVVSAPARLPASGVSAPAVTLAPNLSANLLPTLASPRPRSVLPSLGVILPNPVKAAVAALPAAPQTVAVTAHRSLEATQAVLSESPAAPKSAEAGYTTARSAFDAGSPSSISVPSVAIPAGPVSRSGLARPSVAANQVSGRSAPEAPRGGAKVRALEFVETAMYGGGGAVLAGLIAGAISGVFPLMLPPAMGLASHMASRTMFDQLGSLRGTVVDGWQASHDQRYRVGGDGRLRDVRGHKYGADRYERYAPGPVGRTASALIRAAGIAAGAAWLWGTGLSGWALYAAVFIGLEVLAVRQRAAKARAEGPVSDEGRAHADRFNHR